MKSNNNIDKNPTNKINFLLSFIRYYLKIIDKFKLLLYQS